jgi:acyl-CoA dehydrogenase
LISFADTERAALNAGTVGFDRNIFSGDPSLNDLKQYAPKLSDEEKGSYCVRLF